MKTISFLAAGLILLTSCGGSGDHPDNAAGTADVVEKFWDGSPKRTILRDPSTSQKVGEIEHYESEAKFREWQFANGLKNGEARSYREDGTPWSLNTYRNDTLHGPYKTWHENGALYIDGQYRQGNRSGVWKFYSPEGELIRETRFDSVPAE
jgi:antitoxin component YwqK of YwqJK toxin-antitoxin module